MVVDHGVGLEDVGTDLAAPGNLRLRGLERRPRLLLLGGGPLEERGLEHLHRRRAVLVLRALLLAGDDDPGRLMRDPDRRVRLVHMLPSGARRAEGVDPEIPVVDLDLDILVHLGIDKDRGEGGVSARLRIEGRDANEHPDRVLLKTERDQLVQHAIDQLPSKQRMVITLFYMQQMKYREIAELLDCSEGTVASRLNTAVKNLKSKFEGLNLD